jgi:hypothetical protein
MGRPLSLFLFSSCLFLLVAPDLTSAQGDTLETTFIPIALETPGQTPQSPGAAPAPEKTQTGLWTSLWHSMTDEAHITLGIGILQSTLDIKRTIDGATATMVQRDNTAFFFSYSTRPSFFKDSNFGYTFMVNYVNFDMKRQELPNDVLADIGTEVKGAMIYAVPTLYYQWGEHRYNGTFVRLGVGAGVGAATYTGTIRLTNGETVSTSSKSYAPRLTLSDFLEARWHHFGISMSYAAPRIYGDEYDIKVSDFSVSVGYTYYF